MTRMMMYRYRDVVEWTCEEVGGWLHSRGYNDSLCQIFLDIDGEQLLELTERSLGSLVNNGILRKRLWRDVRQLLRMLDYTDTPCETTALLLTRVHSDLVEYSHRLVAAGLAVETLHMITDIDQRLETAGVENMINYHRIRAALEREQCERQLSDDLCHVVISSNNNNSSDAVITSNNNSRTFASLVDIYLRLRGVRTSTDTGSLDNAASLVVVLQGTERLDDVLDEVRTAQELDKRVLVVVDEQFNLEQLYNIVDDNVRIVRWIHDYQEAAVDRIESFIRESSQTCTNLITTSSLLASVSIDSGICDL